MLNNLKRFFKQEGLKFKHSFKEDSIQTELWRGDQKIPYNSWLDELEKTGKAKANNEFRLFCIELEKLNDQKVKDPQSLREYFTEIEVNSALIKVDNSLHISYVLFYLINFEDFLDEIEVSREIFNFLKLPRYKRFNLKIKSRSSLNLKNYALEYELFTERGKVDFTRRGSVVSVDGDRFLITPKLRVILDHLDAAKTDLRDEYSRAQYIGKLKEFASHSSVSLPKEIKNEEFISYEDIQVIVGREPNGNVVIEPNLFKTPHLSGQFSTDLNKIDLEKGGWLNITADGKKYRVALSKNAVNTVKKVKELKDADEPTKEKVINSPNDFFTNEQLGLVFGENYSDRITGFIFGKVQAISDGPKSKNGWQEGFEDASLLIRSKAGSLFPVEVNPMPEFYEELAISVDKLISSKSEKEEELRKLMGDDFLTPLPPDKEIEIRIDTLGGTFNLSTLLPLKKRIESSNTPELDEGDIEEASEVLGLNPESKVVIWDNQNIPFVSLQLALNRFKSSSPTSKSVTFEVQAEIEKIKADLSSFALEEEKDIPGLKPSTKLKDHQIKGVSWLKTLNNGKMEPKGAFLADDMGVGKTLQVLAFISYVKATDELKKKPILVVAPLSLINGSWIKEGFEEFIESGHISTSYDGKYKVRKLSDFQFSYPRKELFNEIQSISQKSLVEGRAIGEYPLSQMLSDYLEGFKAEISDSIIMTSYETLRSRSFELGIIDFSLIVLDEAQKIKNSSSAQARAALALKSDFRIAMTGTPIENTIMDLWSVMAFAVPGKLGTRTSFKSEFLTPLSNCPVGTPQRMDLVKKLQDFLHPHWIRRTKSEVLVGRDALPPIHHYDSQGADNNENFHGVELSEIQRQIYREKIAFLKTAAKGEKLAGIRSLLITCSAPWLLTGTPVRWSNHEILFNECPKLEKTFEILESVYQNPDKGSKVIIFANVIQIQDSLAFLINDWLRFKYGQNIPVEVYNGRADDEKRIQILENFKSAPGFKVVIISPKVGGAGLNIKQANHVIHYTREWNPALENQATDRAYRMGQKNIVHVYYPTTVGDSELSTAEEKLAKILQSKREVMKDFTVSVSDFDIYPGDIIDVPDDVSREVQIKFEDIPSLSPKEFEILIGIIYQKMGFKVCVFGKSKDSGVDLFCKKDGQNLMLQVKQRQSSVKSFGNDPINEIRSAWALYAKKHNLDYELFVITNGHFSSSAFHHAEEGTKVSLLQGENLSSYLSETPVLLSEIDKFKNDFSVN